MNKMFHDLTSTAKSESAQGDLKQDATLSGSELRAQAKLTKLGVSRGEEAQAAQGDLTQIPSKALRGSMVEPKVRGYHYKMKGHVEQCVLRYLELAAKPASCLKKVATPCIDDHQLSPEDFTTKGELSHVCARIVLKALYAARSGRPDCLWAVNSLAREATKWNVACDKRLFRLICYMHTTESWTQQSWVGDSP